METTTELLKRCFKKAGMTITGDRGKYLFQLLSSELDRFFEKRKKKIQEDAIIEILHDGYEVVLGHYTLHTATNAMDYNGDKELVVSHAYRNSRGFDTVKGAMKYIESSK